jgi:hypothetical protein
MSREAFGPKLRRIRVHRRIGLERIVVSTRIPQDLLEGLEQSDFSRWPTGIQARAYVAQYAAAIGLDPHQVVDEFCRWFPHGDRRASLERSDQGTGADPQGQPNPRRRLTDVPLQDGALARPAGRAWLAGRLRRLLHAEAPRP